MITKDIQQGSKYGGGGNMYVKIFSFSLFIIFLNKKANTTVQSVYIFIFSFNLLSAFVLVQSSWSTDILLNSNADLLLILSSFSCLGQFHISNSLRSQFKY